VTVTVRGGSAGASAPPHPVVVAITAADNPITHRIRQPYRDGRAARRASARL
jgi:hypothetical protein